jgi:hypothetical protein
MQRLPSPQLCNYTQHVLIHRSARVRELCNAAGVILENLPLYSLDYNLIDTVVNKQSCLGITWELLGVAKQLNPIRLLAVLVATQSIKGGLLGVA